MARVTPWLYAIICVTYAALIVTNTTYLSPLEDLGLVGMFQDHEWYGIAKTRLMMGRFNLLLGLDIYLPQGLHTLRPLTHTTYGVAYFYLFIAVGFLVSAYLAHRVISLKITDRWIVPAYLMALLLFLSHMFVSVHFRLLFTERYLFAVFLVAILLMHRYERNRSYRLVFLILLAANIGIQLKEVAFTSITCLGVFYLYRFRISPAKDRMDAVLGAGLIASAVLYLTLFILFILPQSTDMYGSTDMSYVRLWATTIYRWSFTHPFLMFLWVPLTAVSLGRKLRRGHPVVWSDALNLAGLAYMVSYPLLNLYPNEYYLVPAYAFALYTLTGALGSTEVRDKKLFQAALVLCFLIQLNSVWFGINEIIFQRYNNRNFYAAYQELERRILLEDAEDTAAPPSARVLVADCLTFGRSGIMTHPLERMAFESMGTVVWLGYCSGSLIPPDASTAADQPKQGDYLLYTPYSQINLSEFERDYLAELRRFPAPSWLQMHNLPVWIKRIRSGESMVYNEIAFNGTYVLYRFE